jgi:hypothetical protein
LALLSLVAGIFAILLYLSGGLERELAARVEKVAVGTTMDGVRETMGREPDSVIVESSGSVIWVYYVEPTSWLHNIKFDTDQRVESKESFLF